MPGSTTGVASPKIMSASYIPKDSRKGRHLPRVVTSPSSVCLLDNNFFLLPMHKKQQESGDGEEDAIHDSESEARLQHRARLVEID